MTPVRRYMDRVARLGCVACRLDGFVGTPAQLHHPREGRGMGNRASDWLVIPLCHTHHQGADGIHTRPRDFRARYGDELDLLAKVIELLNE